jgi:leucyl aminopeptidase (aminopeptidase T)
MKAHDDFLGDPWADVFARVLKRSLRLRQGQRVFIDTFTDTLPAAEALATEAHRQGIQPFIVSLRERFLEPVGVRANTGAASFTDLALLRRCDGYVLIPPTIEHFKHLDELTTPRRAEYQRRTLVWNREIARRAAPSVYLSAASTTALAARSYGVNFTTWRREALRASVIDSRALERGGHSLATGLRRGHRLTIKHSNGTHLVLGLVGRDPRVDDGVVKSRDLRRGRIWTSLPAGSVTVALDEGVAEGRFVANRPARHRRGTIRRLDLTFRKGRLDHFEMAKGREIFENSYRAGGRERNLPGALSIGLNREIRDFPLSEDLERGVITLYVGHNEDFGGQLPGKFRSYALLRGADLSIDGRVMIDRGKVV